MGKVFIGPGKLMEADNELIIEIPVAATHLQAEEQLEELKRPHPMFIHCREYKIESEHIYMTYEKSKMLTAFFEARNFDLQRKLALSMELLRMEELIGTQFTTYLFPQNIFVTDRNEIKLLYRGIRSVLPPDHFDSAQLLLRVKYLLLFLFSDLPFEEIETSNMLAFQNNPFLKKVYLADSMDWLKTILQAKAEEMEKQQQSVRGETDKQETEVKENPANRKYYYIMALIGCLLFGGLAGVLGTYWVKVTPASQQLEELKSEQAKLEEKIGKMEASEDNQSRLLQAYREAATGNSQNAIRLFEQVTDLTKEDQSVWALQYLNSKNPGDILQAVELDETLAVPAVRALVAIETDEAKKAIQQLASNEPQVLIEKAWLNKDYDEVIKIWNENQQDERAAHLAVESYLVKKEYEAALKVADRLGNLQMQQEILRSYIASIEANSKISENQKEQRLEELQARLAEITT